MLKKLKVGVLGCGSIARQRHAHEYYNNPNVEIKGFYDFDAARAKEMTVDFGGQVYPTLEALLADPEIDAVSVCTANKFHAENTIAALHAGKHVLCEKPMSVTLEDCQNMMQAANQTGKRLMIGHNQRLNATHRRAKEMIASGELGRVISFQTTFGHGGPEMWSVDKGAHTWFFKKDTAFFGSIADLGIHKIDLIRYLLSDDVKNVYSTLAALDKKDQNGVPIEVDDNSVNLITFSSGTLGTVTTSWTYYGQECNTTTLYCEKGIMKLYHDPQYSIEIIHANGMRTMYEIDRMQTNSDAQQASSGVIDEFAAAILENRPSVLDAEDILKSMRVVFACIQSAEQNAPVSL